MTPAAWHDVEVVLSEVMDLPAAERSSRIVQLCGVRADLKTEVESLLSAHEKAASFLEGNAEFDLTAAPAFSLQGKQLGPACFPSWAWGEWGPYIARSVPMADFKSRWRSK